MSETPIKGRDAKDPPSDATAEQKVAASGMGGTVIDEPIPSFQKVDTEKIYKSDYNSYVVLGRDRPSHPGSGYGGQGHTGAGSVDIVAGRDGKEGEFVNNNYETDSARIVVSQKTNLDDNFKISTNFSTKAFQSSGVGIKADHIRIIGRKGIKIVTNTDEKDSFGRPIDIQSGIELVANNDDSTLQPIPLGDNLEGALIQMKSLLFDLTGIVGAFAEQQQKFDIVLANHMHNSPFFGIPTTPSPTCITQGNICQTMIATEVVAGLAKLTLKIKEYEETYLGASPLFPIKSSNNKVN